MAPIAASHEHRFKAIISNDGIYNIGKFIEAQFPTKVRNLLNSGNKTAYDDVMDETRLSPGTPTEVR